MFFLAVTETMLRLYCDKVGISYQDRMLNWEEAPSDMSVSTHSSFNENSALCGAVTGRTVSLIIRNATENVDS